MGDQVTYQQNIRQLFRDRDIQSMSFAFDLSSYDDVRANAEAIYRKLADTIRQHGTHASVSIDTRRWSNGR